jgi:hypothetical protein
MPKEAPHDAAGLILKPLESKFVGYAAPLC